LDLVGCWEAVELVVVAVVDVTETVVLLEEGAGACEGDGDAGLPVFVGGLFVGAGPLDGDAGGFGPGAAAPWKITSAH
jgi:hypothetical protein